MTLNASHYLLVVEDSDEDFETWLWLLRQAGVKNRVERSTEGEDALTKLKISNAEGTRARPALIVLDLNLPGTDGREVLKQLKEDPELKQIPVVIWSTSSNPRDIEFCYHHGVNGYLHKPVDFTRLKRMIDVFVAYWLELSLLPGSNISEKTYSLSN